MRVMILAILAVFVAVGALLVADLSVGETMIIGLLMWLVLLVLDKRK